MGSMINIQWYIHNGNGNFTAFFFISLFYFHVFLSLIENAFKRGEIFEGEKFAQIAFEDFLHHHRCQLAIVKLIFDDDQLKSIENLWRFVIFCAIKIKLNAEHDAELTRVKANYTQSMVEQQKPCDLLNVIFMLMTKKVGFLRH